MFNFGKLLFKNSSKTVPATDKKTAEQTNEKAELCDTSNKLALILSAISDPVIALDSNGKIILFNPAAEKLTGATFQEVQNQSITQILKLYQDNIEIPLTQFITTDKTSDVPTFKKDEVKFMSFKNKQGVVNLISNQIKGGDKADLGCIITLHDITELKSFEAMKLDFVSMAAHELRTPLTSIKGYLSVFMSENKGKFTDDQNTFLTRISISTEQLLDLVENLLNVSKIERGIFNVSTVSTDWVEIVKQTFDQFAERAKEKNLEYTLIKPTSPIPKLMLDKLRIVEVISNLLSNAIAYTPPGGKIKVSIKLSPDKDSVITSVADTGEGIPKEAIPHLFTKFFRVSGKLEQGSKGTGLGLYISKEITLMHHGKIWVDSEAGKGSTFSFSLPIEPSN
ncbi:MAG: ATP-binding protein [Candidatus Daviesbacteria bacterium]|nr:ATP-binding protein [Candidatus Daviesbacteria bacterium]